MIFSAVVTAQHKNKNGTGFANQLVEDIPTKVLSKVNRRQRAKGWFACFL